MARSRSAPKPKHAFMDGKLPFCFPAGPGSGAKLGQCGNVFWPARLSAAAFFRTKKTRQPWAQGQGDMPLDLVI